MGYIFFSPKVCIPDKRRNYIVNAYKEYNKCISAAWLTQIQKHEVNIYSILTNAEYAH